MSAVHPEISAILVAWQKHILNLKPPRNLNEEEFVRDYFYAGSWRACRRRMVLEATHPNFFPEFDVDAKARFIRGEQREIDMRQALERAGQLSMPSFTVEGQQERVMLRDRKGRKVISGKKDCSIRWESGTRWSVEFKSWSPFLTDRVFTFADLMLSPYTRSGAMQILAYLYAKDERMGLFVLDRPGLPRLLPVSLEEHIQLMEDFLVDAEIGRDHIEAKTLPDFIQDPNECRRCPIFGAHCQPPVAFEGAALITNPESIAEIERHEATREYYGAYNGAHDNLKELLKPMVPKTHTKDNKRQIIAGDFLITAHWSKNTTIEMPTEVKKAYQKVDNAGKFNFSIERVTEEKHEDVK